MRLQLRLAGLWEAQAGRTRLAVGITQHGGGALLESLHLRAQHQVVHNSTTSTTPRLSRLPAGGCLAPEQSMAQGYVPTVLPCRQQWPHNPRVHTSMTPHQFTCPGVMRRGVLLLLFGASCRAAPWVVAPGVCALAAEDPSPLTLGCPQALCDGWYVPGGCRSVCPASPSPLPSRSLAREWSVIKIGNWAGDAPGRDLGNLCAFPYLSTDLIPALLLVSLSRSGLSHPCVSLPRQFVLCITTVFFQGWLLTLVRKDLMPGSSSGFLSACSR